MVTAAANGDTVSREFRFEMWIIILYMKKNNLNRPIKLVFILFTLFMSS